MRTRNPDNLNVALNMLTNDFQIESLQSKQNLNTHYKTKNNHIFNNNKNRTKHDFGSNRPKNNSNFNNHHRSTYRPL